jgi:hypothetical protein
MVTNILMKAIVLTEFACALSEGHVKELIFVTPLGLIKNRRDFKQLCRQLPSL